MDILISLPGGERVDARFDGYTVTTDQDGSVPSPFDLFLASLGTCAGFYVASFCARRGLSTEGIRIVERVETDPVTEVVTRIAIEIELPAGFPAEYRAAVVRAAKTCSVKKLLERPPAIEVVAT